MTIKDKTLAALVHNALVLMAFYIHVTGGGRRVIIGYEQKSMKQVTNNIL